MLTVSDSAADAIRQIVTRPGVPEGSGLRIDKSPDDGMLRLAVSPAPEAGDMVYEAGADALLFVAETVAEQVDDKTFDVRTDGTGDVQFILDLSTR